MAGESKQYTVRPMGATQMFEVELAGEIVVSGFPSFDSAATWLREFIMAVIAGQLTAMVAAGKIAGRAS